MCHRGSFREDINEKCILFKNADNGIKHVINECEKLKTERNNVKQNLKKIIKELNLFKNFYLLYIRN